MGVKLLKRAGTQALDFVLPPRCAGCGDVVGEPDSFCAECWAGIDWLATGCCTRCAMPIEGSDHDICAACEASPPLLSATQAVASYDERTRSLVMRLKYGRKVGLARMMGRAMARKLDGSGSAMLVPVPLHRRRLWVRGFNQAGLLAAQVGRDTGYRFVPDLLQRVRPTAAMVRMTPAQREKNVRGAFRVTNAEAVAGERIILVDDVRTSGSTLEACAKVLLAAGARQVEAILWARVVRGRDITR